MNNPFVIVTLIIAIFAITFYAFNLIEWKRILKPQYGENNVYAMLIQIVVSITATGAIMTIFLLFQ